MTHEKTTATVETLTATVKTLMIGRRQVTLSVYNQLDEVNPGEITPMGRVNPKGVAPGRVYVVGAAQDGSLARSSERSDFNPSAYARWVREHELCARVNRLRPRRPVHSVSWPYAPDEPEPGIARDLEMDGLLGEYLIAVMESRELGRRAFEEHGATAERADAWARLPLIVLAGLR